MIKVEEVSKNFGEVKALKKISFQINKGQIVGFLGANGAGKTTMMDIICGCMGVDQGQVTIGGFDIQQDHQKAKALVGYLPDEPPIFMDMLVEEFITYCAKINGVHKSKLKQRVEETIAVLELGSVRKRLIDNLSKGYKQRVGLAQAIVHEPALLILDEPTEGLDPNQIALIRDLIKSLAGKHTIMLSSHILSEVEATCDYLIIIDKGSIVAQGTYQDLINKFESSAKYSLGVHGDLSEAKLLLENTAGVSEIQENRNLIEFKVEGATKQDVVDAVAHAVLTKGLGLQSLTPHKTSLEDIFFEITR